jgi:Transglycosylase SLT domain
MVNVPAQYQSDINAAASATGLPVSVVAAQIQMESNFNPNAVSSAGAEGIAQFEPSTFAKYGSGSPFNVNDAFAAYDKYMSALLSEYGGNVAEALSAYNSGSPTAAISSYADPILSAAGESPSLTAQSISGATTDSIGSDIEGGFFTDLLSALGGISMKEFAERLGLILLGGLMVLMGLIMLAGPERSLKAVISTAVPEAGLASTIPESSQSNKSPKKESKPAEKPVKAEPGNDLPSMIENS